MSAPAPPPAPVHSSFPAQSQINAAIRYAGASVGSIASIMVLLSLIDTDTSTKLIVAFHKFFDDLQALIGDLYVIAALVGPIIVVWLARIGVKSASPQAQVASVQALAPKELTAAVRATAPKELIAAVQALPAADVTVTDPKLAEGIPGVKVVPPQQL